MLPGKQEDLHSKNKFGDIFYSESSNIANNCNSPFHDILSNITGGGEEGLPHDTKTMVPWV